MCVFSFLPPAIEILNVRGIRSSVRADIYQVPIARRSFVGVGNAEINYTGPDLEVLLA